MTGTVFKLWHFGLRKIIQTIASVNKHGFTLLALLDSVRNTNSGEACLQDEHEQLTYSGLYAQSVSTAAFIHNKYSIASKSKVAIISANSLPFIKSLFAASGLGADIFLLNPNQNKEYYSHFFGTQKIDLIISKSSIAEHFTAYKIPFLSFNTIPKYYSEIAAPNITRRKKSAVIILSSGSKGKPKPEKRKLAALKYLNPLLDIIEKLELRKHRSVLISVPIFHGYGFAALLLSVFMGKKIYLTNKFDAQKTAAIAAQNDIDCWIAVPLMIQKVLGLKETINIKSIISGGDTLSAALIKNIQQTEGIKIFNLYGTSETGVCTIATDEDLRKHPNTIGKVITGVKTRLADNDGSINMSDKTGLLSIKCSWSSDDKNGYVATGDLVSKNSDGYYFYKGRNDDMIIIGGENVYPVELENSIYKHPAIAWVKASSTIDEYRSVKMHVDIVIHSNSSLETEEFLSWLSGRVPNYMIPKSVNFLDQVRVSKLM